MNLSQQDLYRIVLEEYLISEGHRGNDAAEDLLRKILGDKYRPPEERDPTRYAKHGGDTEPMEKPHAPEEEEDLTGVVDAGETYPIDPEGDEAPIRARQSMSPDSLADAIGELIHGRDPEEVAEIFQIAFERLPGVELSRPGDEDYPGEETLYAPGAEGRPAAGFRLEELVSLIQEVLKETEWHDITAGDSAPFHSTGDVTPLTTVQRLEKSYHELQETFDELEDEGHQDLASTIIENLQTLMDIVEHPEDYRE